ncbi:hypothetical protein BX265_5666 [Streptomyces sp. TLI_235]|nr:hypothetical protein [Streptomyces sp. TLI_235]PBC71086.1 hypothetical protein BX265_5666 [Streptomyces sp. TLI_235]
MTWYEGPCRITVVGVDADWPQRIVVDIRRGETVVIRGTVGASELIDDSACGHGWDLSLEHEYNGVWRPNVRATQGKWADVDGVRSQLVWSKDHDWPDRANRERNVVIRIDRAEARRPAAERTTRAVPVGTESAARKARTTSAVARGGRTEAGSGGRVATSGGGWAAGADAVAGGRAVTSSGGGTDTGGRTTATDGGGAEVSW